MTQQLESKQQKKPHGFFWELGMLLLKVGVIAGIFLVIFTFIFGQYRNADISMGQAVGDGDLVIYYRMDKSYAAGDLVVLSYEGKKQTRRVMATAGDSVDIREDGLYINGAKQQETKIHEATYRYATDVEFPLVVGEGQVFVLGDGRENAADSRIYGCVDIKNTAGKVTMVLRTRGF